MTGRTDGAPAWRTARAAALLSAVCAAVLLTGGCATNTVPYDTTPPADAAPAPDDGPVGERSPQRTGEFDDEFRDEWADSCRARRGEADNTPDSTMTAFSVIGEIRTIDPGVTCTEPDFGRSAGEKLHMCCDGTWQPL